MAETKAFKLKFEKRLARYEAFVKWAGLDYYPRPTMVKQFIRGLINKHDLEKIPAIVSQISRRPAERLLDISQVINKKPFGKGKRKALIKKILAKEALKHALESLV